MPRVAIIVLNWNRPDETIDCLASLASLEFEDYEVIVVDNGSTDGSVDRIRAARPGTIILETGANLGYGAGNNVGIRTALERGSEFVWVLNNDTVVEPDSLAILTEAMASRDAGVASPKILVKDDPNTIWYAGGAFEPNLARVTRFRAGKRDREEDGQEVIVSFAPGASLLVRRAVLQDVGLFNERYFLYWEDVDFCHRLTRAGWKILYVPRAVIYHVGGASTDEPRGQSVLFCYYNTRNLLWYIRAHLQGFSRAIAMLYTAGYLVRQAFAIALGAESRKAPKLKALARGLSDGLCTSSRASIARR